MRRLTCHLLHASALAALLALGACVAPPPKPVPAPRPAPAPPPPPAPAPPPPAPEPTDWMDAPQTPGDWSYRATADGSGAFFGVAGSQDDFALLCRTAGHTVQLVRTAALAAAAPMTIRTESGDRALNAMPQAPGVAATLAASDSVLDAMAYSKGRFAVEVAGTSTLYLPAWPEVARVLEDCR